MRDVSALVIGLLCLLAQAAGASTAGSTSASANAASGAALNPLPRLPIPHPAEQAKAEELVRELFEREYASPLPADRRALAAQLLQQGTEPQDDPASRFVLLSHARAVASAAGDVATACRAIEHLARHFEVDELILTLETLSTSERHLAAPASAQAAAPFALAAVDRALQDERLDLALRLLPLAERCAATARSVPLVNRAQSRRRDIEFLQADLRQADAARETLRHNPDDADANLIVGRFLCFRKGDWDAGLPMLAKGADPLFRALARDELAGLDDAGRCFEVATTWWELAQSQTGLPRKQLLRHAEACFRRSLPKLTGLTRSIAEKRLASLEAEAVREMGLAPGLIAELFNGADFRQKRRVRIDSQIDFDWGSAAPDETLGRDNFSLRWTALFRIPVSGRYELLVQCNTGVRIWIGDQQVFENENMTRLRNGARLALELPAGFHPIKVEYWDTTGLARMRLLWRPPGAAADEPVPSSAFYHEVLGRPGGPEDLEGRESS